MRVSSPPGAPVAIYDGECRFCGRWVDIWKQKAASQVEFLQLQDERVQDRFPEIALADLQKAFHLIEVNGTVHHGAKAVYRLLALIGETALDWAYEWAPGFAPVSEAAYGLIARNRMVISMLTRAFIPRRLAVYNLVSEIFLRGLGLIYLAAFWSLGAQLPGLIGSAGIVPVAEGLSQGSALSFVDVPTLCLWNTSDQFISAQCWVGVIVSLALVMGFAPWLCLIALWVLYLSLTVAGGVFLSFQWDNCLLEAGLLAIFLPRWRLWLTNSGPPSRAVIWLYRWLMFRLMFESGCVKLLSGDETWWFLTALDYHYHTQPLPTPLAWHAHQLPGWFNAAFVAGMHIIELALPFLIFVGRRARLFAALGFVGLQAGILLTGNYGFFNLLTIVLCIPLLDDEWMLRGKAVFKRGVAALRKRPAMEEKGVAAPAIPRNHPAQWWLLLFARTGLIIVVLFMSAVQLLLVLRINPRWPDPIVNVYSRMAAFRSINAYGLFANMTTERAEIIVEGSMDGESWHPYEFRFKPGDPKQAPPQIGPHMPRLDWQMWFAALGPFDQSPWFINFCARLLQNEPTVTRLLARNPFPNSPPRFIRAQLWEYRFTNRDERQKTGAWWSREFKGEYLPQITFDTTERPPDR